MKVIQKTLKIITIKSMKLCNHSLFILMMAVSHSIRSQVVRDVRSLFATAIRSRIPELWSIVVVLLRSPGVFLANVLLLNTRCRTRIALQIK